MRACIAIDGHYKIALRVWGQLLGFCENKRRPIRLDNLKSTSLSDKEGTDGRRVTVLADESHMMSREERRQETIDRAAAYLSVHNRPVNVKKYLGDGSDGWVWETDCRTAVKVFLASRGYFNERDSYERLAEYGCTKRVGEFAVPEMVGFDDNLMVVEMDFMQMPPYVIDFAKVRLNSSPEFSEEIIADQEVKGLEQFEHNWPRVKTLLRDLESLQIYYLDPQRGNITFPDMP